MPSNVIIKKKQIRPKLPCTRVGCKRTFLSPKRLQDHVDYRHDRITNNLCDHVDIKGVKCGFTCEQACHLVSHKKHRHNRDELLQCKCCERRFPNPSALKAHEKFVKGVFDNVCDHVDGKNVECRFKCEQASTLTVHMRTHDPELKIPCKW